MSSKKSSFEDNLREHFSKASRHCPNHTIVKGKEGHRCICTLVEGTCSKFDCPRINRRNYRKDREGRFYDDEEY